MSDVRVSQDVVEAVLLPTSQKALVSQDVVEAVLLPTSQKARVSQRVVEVVLKVTPSYPHSFAVIARPYQ